MNQDHGFILAIYAAFAGVILVAGFLYKELRNHRDRKNKPSQPRQMTFEEEEEQRQHHHVAAAR